MASSCASVPAGRLVLHQGFAQLAEAYALFFEPGLQLVELLEVRVSVTPQCYGCINHMHNMSIIIYSSIS